LTPEASERASAERPRGTRAGIVIRSARGRHFVPAATAKRLAPRPSVTPVPGTDFGMALVSGQVVSVIDLGGPATATLLVCETGGQLVALSGIEAERAGFFEAVPDGVAFEGGVAFDLDLGALARSASPLLVESELEA
jgi:hypothetical protein